jgi:hypothetical protein
MARTRSRLTALKVASIKKPGLYADGGNLYLRVAREGSKGWISAPADQSFGART